MAKFHLREATLADIPRLADIWAIAFVKDTFYDMIFPHRSEFSDDYRRMWVTRLRRRFLQPGELLIVAETDGEDANGRPQTKVIVGWAGWMRMGEGPEVEKNAAQSFLKGFERRLFGLEEKLIHPVLNFVRRYPGDRFADAEVLAQFYRDYAEYMQNYWTGDTAERWHLKMLAVDPKWQRNGIGQMLVQFGLEKAQREGVVVGLEASEAGEQLYLRLGFAEIGKFKLPGGVSTIPIFLWRPKSRTDVGETL